MLLGSSRPHPWLILDVELMMIMMMKHCFSSRQAWTPTVCWSRLRRSSPVPSVGRCWLSRRSSLASSIPSALAVSKVMQRITVELGNFPARSAARTFRFHRVAWPPSKTTQPSDGWRKFMRLQRNNEIKDQISLFLSLSLSLCLFPDLSLFSCFPSNRVRWMPCCSDAIAIWCSPVVPFSDLCDNELALKNICPKKSLQIYLILSNGAEYFVAACLQLLSFKGMLIGRTTPLK